MSDLPNRQGTAHITVGHIPKESVAGMITRVRMECITCGGGVSYTIVGCKALTLGCEICDYEYRFGKSDGGT